MAKAVSGPSSRTARHRAPEPAQPGGHHHPSAVVGTSAAVRSRASRIAQVERYVIRGGQEGYERLQLLARERWPDTAALFRTGGPVAGDALHRSGLRWRPGHA